jgi:hypothetical protein
MQEENLATKTANRRKLSYQNGNWTAQKIKRNMVQKHQAKVVIKTVCWNGIGPFVFFHYPKTTGNTNK